MPSHRFLVIARFRNKMEDTTPRGAALSSVEGVAVDHSQPGMLIARFERDRATAREAVREAANQMLSAFPEALQFEVHAPRLDRMEVRRGMDGFLMPWRFWDQGLGDMGIGAEIRRRA